MGINAFISVMANLPRLFIGLWFSNANFMKQILANKGMYKMPCFVSSERVFTGSKSHQNVTINPNFDMMSNILIKFPHLLFKLDLRNGISNMNWKEDILKTKLDRLKIFLFDLLLIFSFFCCSKLIFLHKVLTSIHSKLS